MKKKGNDYIGCCPFHQEKTPSFFIRSKGYYKCFSCTAKGSLSDLVWKLTNQSIYNFLGISKPKNFEDFQFRRIMKPVHYQEKTKKEYSSISIISGKLESVYSNMEVLNYLRERNCNDEFISFFKIQYTKNCNINGINFYNRIMIPIYKDKKLVGYEGRSFDGKKPKVLYCKGCNVSLIFNQDSIDITKPVIITEGFFDIVHTWQSITKNCGHTFGSSLSKEQFDILNTFEELIYFMDNDKAGEEAVSSIDKEYKKEFYIAKPTVEGKDPGDLTLLETQQALNAKIYSNEYILNKTSLFDNNELTW
jgi:DNA primase